jgi:YhcH/YjgK/YiaL family protein
MLLSQQLNSFSNTITQQQIEVVANFLSTSINWDERKHGEKEKLEENISVVFLAANGSNDWKNILEAHKKFYDLHCTMEGTDVLVYKPVADCSDVKTEYNEEGDYALYNETPTEILNAPAGSYCLIPPADAHMALYGDCGFVRKVVFKIPVAG